jgi:hypothetical protein
MRPATHENAGPQITSGRDAHWDLCRNSLGIARLLANEGRPAALIETACRMALECACRAALAQAGLGFEGDLGRAACQLAAPDTLFSLAAGTDPVERLRATERAVGWVADRLRAQAPERSWGY